MTTPLDALAALVGGNARVTIDRDAHGVFSVTHSTRGTFRATALSDAVAALLVACGLGTAQAPPHGKARP